MGAAPSTALAENLVTNTTEVLTSVGNKSVQTAQHNITLSTGVQVLNNSGVTVIKYDGTQYVETDIQAVQDSYFDGSLDTEIKNITDLVADATVDRGGLGSGSSEANNTVSNITNLSYQVNTEYFQDCITTANLNQSIVVDNNSAIVVIAYEGDQIANATSNCAQNNTTALDIVSKITNDVTASATAKVTSSIWSIIILCTLIIVICGLIIFISYSSLIKLVLFLLAFAILGFGIWLMSAWLLGAPPFDDPPDDTPREPTLPEPGETPPPPPEGYVAELTPGGGQVFDAFTFSAVAGEPVSLDINVRSWRNPRQSFRVYFLNTVTNIKYHNRSFYISPIPMIRSLGSLTFPTGSYILKFQNEGPDYAYVGETVRRRTVPPTIKVNVVEGLENPTNVILEMVSKGDRAVAQATFSYHHSLTDVEVWDRVSFSFNGIEPKTIVIPGISLAQAQSRLDAEGKGDPPVAAINIRLTNTGDATLYIFE